MSTVNPFDAFDIFQGFPPSVRRPVHHDDDRQQIKAKIEAEVDDETLLEIESAEFELLKSIHLLSELKGRAGVEAVIAEAFKQVGYPTDSLHNRGLDRLLADIDAA